MEIVKDLHQVVINLSGILIAIIPLFIIEYLKVIRQADKIASSMFFKLKNYSERLIHHLILSNALLFFIPICFSIGFFLFLEKLLV